MNLAKRWGRHLGYLRSVLIGAGSMTLAYGALRGIDAIFHEPGWLRWGIGFTLGVGAYELAWRVVSNTETGEEDS